MSIKSLYFKLFPKPKYILFRFGYDDVIKKVKVWPNGTKTVSQCNTVFVLDEVTKTFQNGRKYYELS